MEPAVLTLAGISVAGSTDGSKVSLTIFRGRVPLSESSSPSPTPPAVSRSRTPRRSPSSPAAPRDRSGRSLLAQPLSTPARRGATVPATPVRWTSGPGAPGGRCIGATGHSARHRLKQFFFQMMFFLKPAEGSFSCP